MQAVRCGVRLAMDMPVRTLSRPGPFPHWLVTWRSVELS